MPHYPVAIHPPDNYRQSPEAEEMEAAKEPIGGFELLDAANMDKVVGWGRNA